MDCIVIHENHLFFQNFLPDHDFRKKTPGLCSVCRHLLASKLPSFLRHIFQKPCIQDFNGRSGAFSHDALISESADDARQRRCPNHKSAFPPTVRLQIRPEKRRRRLPFSQDRRRLPSIPCGACRFTAGTRKHAPAFPGTMSAGISRVPATPRAAGSSCRTRFFSEKRQEKPTHQALRTLWCTVIPSKSEAVIRQCFTILAQCSSLGTYSSSTSTVTSRLISARRVTPCPFRRL